MVFNVLCQGEDESDPARQFRDCMRYVNLGQVVDVLV